MERAEAERRLAAVFYADVAEYSRLTKQDEDETHRKLGAHLDMLTSAIADAGGRTVHFAGDAILAEFSSVLAAVSCAIQVQRKLADANSVYPPEHRLAFRIGVNLGEVIVDRNDLFGDGVNMAARYESLAEPGGICVSERVFEEVDGKVNCDFQFIGEQRVKNHDKPLRPYKVVTRGDGVARPVRGARSAPWKLVLPLGALLMLFAAVWLFRAYVPEFLPAESKHDRTAGPPAPTVAILPFENMSGDPDQEYFSDGITEDLITDLSKIRGLLVIARSSSFFFKGRMEDIREIGAALGARYVVEGSVRRVGETVRINAQLIDASNGHHLWAERYDGELADIFSVQDRIGRQILESLTETLGEGNARTKPMPVDTVDMAAYELFLRGRNLFEQFSRQATRESRAFLERALARDPEFASALAILAWTYVFEHTNGWSEDSDQTLTTALELADRAIALRADLPIAYFARGLVHRERKDYVLALAEAQKAIEIDPNYANGHVLLATVLYYAGRPREGLAMIRKAQRLHPFHPSNYPFHEGQALFILRQYEEALEAFRRGIAQNTSSQRLRVWLAATYAQLGRLEDAEWEVEMVRLSDPNFSLKKLPQAFPFTDPGELEHVMGALRKAGFEEDIRDG